MIFEGDSISSNYPSRKYTYIVMVVICVFSHMKRSIKSIFICFKRLQKLYTDMMIAVIQKASPCLDEAVLTSTHYLCFEQK